MLLKILAILSAIPILIYSVGAFFIFPEFEKLFIGFETDLPFLTKLVMATYPYWLVTLLIPIIIYKKYLTQKDLPGATKNKIIFLFVGMLITSIILFPFFVYVLYLPVLEMDVGNV